MSGVCDGCSYNCFEVIAEFDIKFSKPIYNFPVTFDCTQHITNERDFSLS